MSHWDSSGLSGSQWILGSCLLKCWELSKAPLPALIQVWLFQLCGHSEGITQPSGKLHWFCWGAENLGLTSKMIWSERLEPASSRAGGAGMSPWLCQLNPAGMGTAQGLPGSCHSPTTALCSRWSPPLTHTPAGTPAPKAKAGFSSPALISKEVILVWVLGPTRCVNHFHTSAYIPCWLSSLLTRV